MKQLLLRSSLLCLGLSAFAAPALADDDVDPVSDAPDGLLAVRRGVQGPEGMLAARVTLAVNLSADRVGKPISLAPDIYYSVSDRLQLGLVHDGPMRWQARPGLGLCLTGTDGGCPHLYDNVGFDLLYGLAFGAPLHLSAHAAFYLNSIDASNSMLAVGAAGKVHFNDNLSLFFDPQIGIATSERDANDDAFFMPLELQYQASAPTALKLLSGVSGALSAFDETVQIPMGLGLVRNITETVDLGVRFSFDNLLGKQIDGVSAADARSLALLLQIRN